MMRLTATVSGRVQRVGYRAIVLWLAKGFGLTGMVQNRPDGRVLIIAEGPETDLERFTYAVQIKNTLINVQSVDSEITPASGAYQDFRKITGPDEVGERLDDGIEILKEIMLSIKHSLDKQDQMLDKQDQMLDKQDEVLEEIRQLRRDQKIHIDQRFDRIEDYLINPGQRDNSFKQKGSIDD